MNFIQVPKFNTNICVGDTVIINEGVGTVVFIKGNELTLSNQSAGNNPTVICKVVNS